MSINGTSSKGGVRRRREAREGGMAVMLTAVMLLFTIPTVGLAIDAGLLYVIRGRLTAACDAASLATARNLNLGQTLSEQTAAATVRGNAFFSANFPTGYLGTTGTSQSIAVAQTNMSTLTVTTTATTNAPLYFMRLLGGTTAVAGAIGKASRRDVNLMLVLDRSGSMAGTPCSDMITASKTFVNMFVNGRDTLGLVTFGSSVYLAYPPSNNFRTTGSLLTSAIDLIACSGGTNTSDSYMTAYNQLVSINEPLALNLIVFFTDGYPTAFTANFPVKTVSDTRYGASGLSCGTSQCTIPKSTCVDDLGRSSSNGSWGTFAGKTGAIAAASPASNATGYTLGLMTRTATSSSSGDIMASASVLNGCAMASSWTYLRQDLAYVPDTDINGLATAGYQSVATIPASNPTYSGKKRIDTPINIQNIAMNLADNAAAAARNNSTLNVVTYTIGLGSNGGVDDVLLKRMANDPLSNIYNNAKPDGLYVYAPNSAALNSAFARIAGEILRLAQ
jgi:hypothetical protein